MPIGEADKVSTLIGSLRLSIVNVAHQCGGIRQAARLRLLALTCR
jgi:hypothetical protein